MRSPYITASIGLIASVVLASVAFGSTSSAHALSGALLISIRQQESSQMTTDKTLKGRFTLLVDGVIQDSGTTVLRPNEGATKTVAGQQRTPVFGSETVTTKKGTLTFSFRGVSIAVNNPDDTKDSLFNESGTWRVTSGSGAYAALTGKGVWVSVSTPSADYIEWDGRARR